MATNLDKNNPPGNIGALIIILRHLSDWKKKKIINHACVGVRVVKPLAAWFILRYYTFFTSTTGKKKICSIEPLPNRGTVGKRIKNIFVLFLSCVIVSVVVR